jgi:hypothetical protein
MGKRTEFLYMSEPAVIAAGRTPSALTVMPQNPCTSRLAGGSPPRCGVRATPSPLRAQAKIIIPMQAAHGRIVLSEGNAFPPHIRCCQGPERVVVSSRLPCPALSRRIAFNILEPESGKASLTARPTRTKGPYPHAPGGSLAPTPLIPLRTTPSALSSPATSYSTAPPLPPQPSPTAPATVPAGRVGPPSLHDAPRLSHWSRITLRLRCEPWHQACSKPNLSRSARG